MDEMRKKIVVNEIMYWQKSKILPDQYCNYLLALYTEGEGTAESPVETKKQRKSILLIIVPVVLALIYFLLTLAAVIPIGVSTMLVVLFTLLLLLLAYRYSNQLFYVQLFLITTALLLIAGTVDIWEAFFVKKPYILLGSLSIHCFIWILTGRKLRLHYFTIAGLIGFVILILFIFFQSDIMQTFR